MQELSTPQVRPYVPTPTSVDRPFWTGGADSVLRLPFCESCVRWFFPPAATCPDCNEPAGIRDTSGAGVVYTFTVNVQRFHPEVAVPYVIALVELDDQAGLRIPAGIVGCPPESVEIGMPVTVAFEEVAGTHEDKDRVYVPVFAPSTPGGHQPTDGSRVGIGSPLSTGPVPWVMGGQVRS